MELGRIEPVDLRQVWAHEAHDLTPWLLDNADVLADVLGIDLELTIAEHPVGSFSLDLLGRDLTNGCVLIVENQLTPTDHDHLGKLLTYDAGTEAGTVVWIAPSFRDEHREALDLLNDLGGERVRFFGVELGAVRIADSPPAPLLQVRVQPNDWHAVVAASARSTSAATGKSLRYTEFWGQFLERVKVEHPGWTKASKPPAANWFNMPCPFKGMNSYSLSFSQGGRLRSELYIDSTDADEASALYTALESLQPQLEQVFGGPLKFEELPNRRACRIAVYGDGDVNNFTQHDAFVDWFFDSHERLRAAMEAVALDVAAALDRG